MINEVILLSSLSNAGIVPFEGLYRADGTWEPERTYLAHAFYKTVGELLLARPDAERKPLVCTFLSLLSLALNSRRSRRSFGIYS